MSDPVLVPVKAKVTQVSLLLVLLLLMEVMKSPREMNSECRIFDYIYARLS